MLASEPVAAATVEFTPIIIGVLGGLALFLYGMEEMTNALKAVAGKSMQSVLGKLTTNRISAAFTGAFVTAVIQSSSVTTVLVVGFISAGLMSMQQSIGVIMGANVGTTVTAQLIAFKITKAALPLITVGFAMLFLSKREWVRQSGAMIMGLGMIFLGMGIMSDATYPLRSYQPFIDAMSHIDHPILAIGAAAAFTAVVQSSSATTGIVIVLASQGFITIEAGIALALGANVGTCATALLATLGKPREAVQAAMAHVLFNVGGVILWLPLIGTLASMAVSISPSHPDLEGTARLAAETPRQIANAHTLFNVLNTLVFIWLTGPTAKLIQWLVPLRPVPESIVVQPKFLDPIYLETPAMAVERIRLETGHMGDLVEVTLESINAQEPLERPAPEQVGANIHDVEAIHIAILDYAKKLLRGNLSERDVRATESLLAAGNHLQSIADTISIHVRELLREWAAKDLEASEETRQMFGELHRMVVESVHRSVDAVRDNDIELAAQVIGMKPQINVCADEIARRLSQRLAAADPHRVAVYRLETDIIEIFRRLYYFAKRAAKTVGEVDDPDAASSSVTTTA